MNHRRASIHWLRPRHLCMTPVMLLVACLAALQMLTACASRQADAAAPSSPQQATTDASTSAAAANDDDAAAQGWELVFTDDFNRDELGENWQTLEGLWKVEDGSLVGAGALLSAKGFPGTHPGAFIRMEFDATPVIDAKPLFPGATPIVELSDLSATIHAQPREQVKAIWNTGYFFQFGGQNNTVNRILRQGQELTRDNNPEAKIQLDKTCHIVIENNQGRLQMLVDGKQILQHKDDFAIVGKDYDRVGLFFFTKAKVDTLRVYIKRLPDEEI